MIERRRALASWPMLVVRNLNGMIYLGVKRPSGVYGPDMYCGRPSA